MFKIISSIFFYCFIKSWCAIFITANTSTFFNIFRLAYINFIIYFIYMDIYDITIIHYKLPPNPKTLHPIISKNSSISSKYALF